MTWIAEIRSDFFDECDGRFKYTKNERMSFINISQVYDRMEEIKNKAYKKCRTVDSKIMKIRQE